MPRDIAFGSSVTSRRAVPDIVLPRPHVASSSMAATGAAALSTVDEPLGQARTPASGGRRWRGTRNGTAVQLSWRQNNGWTVLRIWEHEITGDSGLLTHVSPRRLWAR